MRRGRGIDAGESREGPTYSRALTTHSCLPTHYTYALIGSLHTHSEYMELSLIALLKLFVSLTARTPSYSLKTAQMELSGVTALTATYPMIIENCILHLYTLDHISRSFGFYIHRVSAPLEIMATEGMAMSICVPHPQQGTSSLEHGTYRSQTSSRAHDLTICSNTA